jgi:ketosteroid isomerase-like protein
MVTRFSIEGIRPILAADLHSQGPTMTTPSPLQLAQQFLAKMGANASPEEMAALCVPDLAWNIPGDTGALPWIGAKSGNQAVADFVRDSAALMTRDGLEIRDILANDQRAVILGHLQSRVNATGKQIDSEFAMVLTFADDKVASLLMLEDSFAVSVAAHA